MDDLTASLSGQRIQTPTEENWHTEQRRRSFDIIRVKNPTSVDFFVEYDTNQHQRVPANSTIDLPRYMATRYVVHMKDKIVHDQAQKLHDDTIKERNTKGFPNFKSKWEENEETYNSADYPKTNDPKIVIPIINELWVGLVHEFGQDTPPQSTNTGKSEINLDPIEQQIMEGLKNKRVEATDSPILSKGFQATPEPTFAPTQNIPQSEFVPQEEKLDFNTLNETLDKKISPEEVTQ